MNTHTPEIYIQAHQLLARFSSLQIFISLYIYCLKQSHFTIATFIPYSRRTVDSNILQSLHLVLAASMPRLLTSCKLKGAAWFYPQAVAVWRSRRCTLPVWPHIGSENGMRHSWIWCSGGWNGDINAEWWEEPPPPPVSPWTASCNIVLMYYLCNAKIPPLE